MKQNILILIILFGLQVSCSKLYNADINTDKRILVADGMITNEDAPYNIHLSYALPFDSIGTGQPAYSAEVYVTDDQGNNFTFFEKENGNYKSDSVQFTGQPGNTYTLHITTSDGEIYESDPQQLYPGVSPDSLYAEFDSQETLSKINGLKILSHGADVLADISNNEVTSSRFRFTVNLVIQYFYSICPPFQSCYYFYCWQTNNANTSINLTGGEYSENSAFISKHTVCFIDDNSYCNAQTYAIGPQRPDLSYQSVARGGYQNYMIHHRIIYLKQYSLNNEAYLYYKGMSKMLQSEGRLFDPIAVQLNGNIKCISDPEKKALGFFEASSVNSSAYTIDFRNLSNNQPSITEVPYIEPPEPDGCSINNAPSFWIFK
jgi:hypothetical protein